MIKIGVTGGIGSGKSRLCQLLQEGGAVCYDSDRRARELMTNSEELRSAIIGLFGEEAYTPSGELNRGLIASKIFSDSALRGSLNGVVHPAVRCDFVEWSERQESLYVVLESAILFEAGLEEYIDLSVAVLAPEEVRLERVVNRDGCSVEQALSRMASQMSDEELHSRADYSVVNIFEEDLEGSAQRLDQIFRQRAMNELKEQ